MIKLQEYNSGIYQIKNLINGKVYIGSTINFIGRKSNHFTTMNHHNVHLHNAFKQYGKDNFIFTPIQYCNKEELFVNEQYWMNHFKSYDSSNGYNINKIAGSIPKNKNILVTKEPKYVYCYDKAGKFLNKYNSVADACFNTGAVSGEIYRCLKGTKPSANSYRFSSTFKEKLPPFKSKRSNKVLYVNTRTGQNIEFEAAMQAEKYLNIPIGTIYKRIKHGEMKHTEGMIFSYIDN